MAISKDKYILFLRGINISGKNLISMCSLKNCMEEIGFKNVITYLNSGNVIFESDIENRNIMSKTIDDMLKEKFNLHVPIHLLSASELEDIINNHPIWWRSSDKSVYDNIIFVITPTNAEEVYNEIGCNSNEIDQTCNYKNIIFWSYDLNNYRKSVWWKKTANSNIANKITIRTANTVKKLLKLCQD